MITESLDSISNISSGNNLEVDVKISGVLTPLSCSSIINEILKGLLYQRCQIPYPYSWMRNIVTKKREKQEDSELHTPVNFTIDNHFRVVSKVYDTLENIMKGIAKEFVISDSCVKEVVILFGTTPQCPQEIFSINISPLPKGHIERNHISDLNKNQQKILRNIFLSQSWLDSNSTAINCTNTYIYLKKSSPNHSSSDSSTSEENFFVKSRPLACPSNVKHVKINLSPDLTKTNCCKHLLVFGESAENEANGTIFDDFSSDNFVWYQSKELLRGFKNCFVNKVSASELW